MSRFGKKVEEYRERLGIKQNALAKRIGLSPAHLNRIEKGTRNPPQVEVVLAMLAALYLTQEEAEEFVDLAGYSPEVLQRGGVLALPLPTMVNPAMVTPSTAQQSPAIQLPADDQKRALEDLKTDMQGLKAEMAEIKATVEAWQETLELLESFVVWLKFRLEEPLRFAKRLYLQITGPASEVQSFFDEVIGGKHPGLKVVSAPRESISLFARQTHGYEPKSSGTVEFTAYVTEKLAHDYAKSLIEKNFPQGRIEVKVSEDVENL